MNLDVLRTFSDGLGGMASAQNGGGGKLLWPRWGLRNVFGSD